MTGATSRMPAYLRRFPGAVLGMSPDGVVTESNGCIERNLGRELVGLDFTEVLDPASSQQKWARILARASTGQEDGGSPCELILTGENTLPEPRSFSPLWDADTETVWMVEHPRDPQLDALNQRMMEVNSELANTQRELIKERGRLAHTLGELEMKHREMERLSRIVQEQNVELERSNRDLDQFAHVISHDLKAPLRAIGNYAEWIEEDLGDRLAGESREHMELLKRRIRRMVGMVQGVLKYSRAGREESPPERVDIAAMLRATLDLVAAPAGVDVEIGPTVPVLTANRVQLEQVFMNLIGNALKYASRPAGRVRIEMREENCGYEFSVADDGPGIPAGVQDRIWNLFHTSDPADGTGIGLAVVKKLVDRQGGRVWVESAEGAGATFRFVWRKQFQSTA